MSLVEFARELASGSVRNLTGQMTHPGTGDTAMHGNGETQERMYQGTVGSSLGGAASRYTGGLAAPERLPAAGLLNQQIEEVGQIAAEVTKMAMEIEARLIGSVPTSAQNEKPYPTGGSGLLGSASARLLDVRTVLEESRRALQRLMGEV